MLGVQHMHSFNLYNLNVNPENVLISECVKLTDYGLKMEGKNEKPKRNTIYKKKENINYIINAYTSPEELNAILNGKPCILNGKTDSWNCGILLYEMLTSFKSPFKGETDEEIIDSILNCDIDLSPIKDDFCRNLISKLVKKNPKDRISIDEVLNMDYIKNVDIEQPEIDFSDNIINPIDEQEFSRNMSTMSNSKNNTSNSQNKQNNVNTKNQQYNKAMETLKSENDSLKKMIEDLKKQVVSSKIKKKTSKHTSKLKSMVIDVGGEIIADENEGQNLGDLLNDDENNPNEKEKNDNKDNKIDEIKKNIKNEIIEEEEDDDEEFSEKEEEYNDENLFVRCEKYKDRNIQLKDKLLKISRKNKRMKNTIDEYKKEFDNLKSEKNKNILETLEKMNTVPIYQINDLVNVILNSINIFKASQNDFKKSIDKLINLSDEHYTKLSEENRKYIDGKAKLFIDIMNNKITDIEAYNNLNNTNKEVDKKKDDENINYTNKNSVNNVNIINKKDEYKGKYEELLKKQELLKQRIKVLEESLIAKEDLNKITTKNNEELTKKLQEVANNWMNSKATIEDLKRFINENVQQHDKIKKIYEQLHLDK
jgi:hypothetical protein